MLLGVEDGVGLGVFAGLELGVVAVGAAVVELCDVTGAAGCEPLPVEVGAGAEGVVLLLPFGAWPERVSGVALVLAPPVTEAVGAVPGAAPLPRRTMTSAVESAAMTAAARTPITHPALPPPRPPFGGSLSRTRA